MSYQTITASSFYHLPALDSEIIANNTIRSKTRHYSVITNNKETRGEGERGGEGGCVKLNDISITISMPRKGLLYTLHCVWRDILLSPVVGVTIA